MTYRTKAVIAVWVAALIAIVTTACHTPSFQAGGAYSGQTVVTNAADGSVVTNTVTAAMPELYIADSAYKLAYQAIDGVFLLEYQNRAQFATSLPQLKPFLDKMRPVVWEIDQRWAAARKAYKANPTPAGLTTLQTILSQIQALVPTIQAGLVQPPKTATSN